MVPIISIPSENELQCINIFHFIILMDEDLKTERQYNGSILIETILVYICQSICNCRKEHRITINFNEVKLNIVKLI